MRTADYRLQQEKRMKKRKDFLSKNGRGYPIPYILKKTINNKMKEVSYFKEYYLGKNYSYSKNHLANKKVRKYEGYIPKRGGYKKVFELWW